MHRVKVANGIWWVSIPEEGLSVLCGCPADSVKHLIKRGLISTVEREGKTFETGPNAILLSDVAVQNGEFTNLAEFPVLQMLYRQGMAIPGHPRNDGTRPLLLGIDRQVKAQSRYILRGTYGLLSPEELQEVGMDPELAAAIFRMKLKFAFGKIRETGELLDVRIVGPKAVKLRGGAVLRRKSFNVYEFTHGSSSVTVDLNLQSRTSYESPYALPPRSIRRGYFSVVHVGEGDGWDPEKPCMGSLVVFQGRIYLVDAGPHILSALMALGIGVNEVEGIFQTHAHDDHFAGLTTLVKSDHRIKYFAAPAVRASVVKKLSSLMDFKESRFARYFDVVDLGLDAWNDIDGLEVKPVLSAHPVETTVLFFRARGAAGPVTYAHLADIASFDVLRGMVTEDPTAPGISSAFMERLQRELLSPVTLKKVDAGEGAIHGSWTDFQHDKSERVVLSHVCGAQSDAQKQVGSLVAFGQEDVLISGNEEYALARANEYLSSYFSASPHEIRALLNCPQRLFPAGTLILRKGSDHDELFFILHGVVEVLDLEQNIRGSMAAGGMIGEYSALHRSPAIRTFRAISDVLTLMIPISLYDEFLIRTGLLEETRRVLENRQFLQDTWLFGDMISFPVLRNIAGRGSTYSLVKGQSALVPGGLHVVREGRIELADGGRPVEELAPGAFFGEDVLLARRKLFEARAVSDALVLQVSNEVLNDIPIVQWRLLETLERRLMTAAKKSRR